MHNEELEKEIQEILANNPSMSYIDACDLAWWLSHAKHLGYIDENLLRF